MYDHLFFDADGTLFDFVAAERWALSQVFTLLNVKPSTRALNTYSQINNEAWLEFEQGLITLETLKIERFRRFQTIYGIAIDPELTAKHYAETLAKSFQLYNDAIPVLEELSKQHYPISLITNGISEIQRGRLVATGTLNYFKAIVISEEIGVQKPNPAYFHKAVALARASGATADNPLVIGDSLTSDIRGGINAGLDTCWVNRFGMERDESTIPTYEITSLKELLPILEH
ncbi:MAG: YjjG family noncanonical pyrimidine nucleotidase [Sphaerochaetaceae bacterium]|jgi:YjjG family noncanonical pyrimidine nucleotidase|nr:YjjG family noncanonical pyrimidine nucleotidase [Sphaerochaetaceae bacterium]MDD3365944.1 YjjG family noncanonical pyrimidine nucleotidase [Sphaerochaetaceae bacterium]MDD4218634.1 YjjG family noncanonical pyrimidine nucleotidase [Sphaerochaetaceae bacterium]MDY0371276.1 YjjG family noncanonical pyrimidine nucleotidase [Sphaerochaetaceae bacterium]